MKPTQGAAHCALKFGICLPSATGTSVVFLHLQVPGLSTTGSSCCSVGRPLWPARLPNCPTSQESPGLSNPPPPGTLCCLSRRSATAMNTTSTQRRAQVKHLLTVRTKGIHRVFPLSGSVSSISRWRPVWNGHLRRRQEGWQWFVMSLLLFVYSKKHKKKTWLIWV